MGPWIFQTSGDRGLRKSSPNQKTDFLGHLFSHEKRGMVHWFTKNARNHAHIGFNPHSCCVNSQLSALCSPILVKACKSNIHLRNMFINNSTKKKKRYLFQWFIITNQQSYITFHKPLVHQYIIINHWFITVPRMINLRLINTFIITLVYNVYW